MTPTVQSLGFCLIDNGSGRSNEMGLGANPILKFAIYITINISKVSLKDVSGFRTYIIPPPPRNFFVDFLYPPLNILYFNTAEINMVSIFMDADKIKYFIKYKKFSIISKHSVFNRGT